MKRPMFTAADACFAGIVAAAGVTGALVVWLVAIAVSAMCVSGWC